jgi:hypothetical protein
MLKLIVVPNHDRYIDANRNSHSNRNTISDDNTTCNINVQMSLLKTME